MGEHNSPSDLSLDSYRKQIKLDELYDPGSGPVTTGDERIEIVTSLIDILINREHLAEDSVIPDDYPGKRRLLRALLNVRPPGPFKESFHENINRLLWDETREKEIFDCKTFIPLSDMYPGSCFRNGHKMFLWKGDITRLWVDAIVNAANDRLLGCFQPLHNCIDNVIHSAAGPQLREDCKTITDITGHPEPTGSAKITRAYNLPSDFVLHTAGPIIHNDVVSELQKEQLASCYRNCLLLAGQIRDIRSIAFPCISTGVYSFPGGIASEIALNTVDEWLAGNPSRFTHVVFNVFLEEDFDFYVRSFCRADN